MTISKTPGVIYPEHMGFRSQASTCSIKIKPLLHNEMPKEVKEFSCRVCSRGTDDKTYGFKYLGKDHYSITALAGGWSNDSELANAGSRLHVSPDRNDWDEGEFELYAKGHYGSTNDNAVNAIYLNFRQKDKTTAMIDVPEISTRSTKTWSPFDENESASAYVLKTLIAENINSLNYSNIQESQTLIIHDNKVK